MRWTFLSKLSISNRAKQWDFADRAMKRHPARARMEERVAAQRVTIDGAKPLEETVAIEEPLEIHINGQPWVTTMRTPGQDRELALGLLYSEGLFVDYVDIDAISV